MEVTENDFSKEFLERFEDKEKQYVLDFCNTFLRTFPNVIDKQILLDKLSRIKAINPDRYGALGKDIYGETYYEDCSIVYRDGQDERDERNTIYHEIFHVLSFKKKAIFNEIGLFHEGVISDNGNSYYEYVNNNPETGKSLDEIMNEYYTIKMLENEGRFLEEEHIIKAPTKTQPKITITDKGIGYTSREFLAEIYHQSFGDDLLKAKILGRDDFVSKFNNDFKDMNIRISDNSIKRPNFSKIGIQISENLPAAQVTAINIWKQKMMEKSQKEGFNLYEYLKSSHLVMKTLPNVHSRNKTMVGNVNNELISSHEELIYMADEEIIMQQLRPDLVGEQTETEKIIQKKQFLGVISTLRDKIEGLTSEDVEKVSYGEMSLYNHSNLSCLIVSAGKKNFMTFASEDGYRGSSEFSNLPKDQIREIFGDDREVEYATVPTPRHKWSIIKDNNGYIPLTDNPNMEHVELTDEVYLDGSSVEKTADSKDGQGMGLRQEHETIVDNNDNTTESRKFSSFEESLKADSTQNKKGKMSSASFKASLATKRKENRTGQQDINKSKNIIALRRERDRLSRGENLSEEQINRLNEINDILSAEQASTKKYNGIGR